MSKQEIIESLYEGLNGLSMGWMMANVRDDEKRNELQAPINAGRDALLKVLAELEGQS